MSQRFAFTTTRVEKAACPPGKSRVYFRDEQCPHLWLTVTSKGARSFNVYKKINRKPCRVLIGVFPEVSVDAARKEANKLVGQIATGTDPRAARRELRHGTTLGDLFADYLETYSKERKKSWDEDEKQYNRYLTSWASRPIVEIQQHHVASLHSKLGRDHGHYAANRLLALLHGMFQWAIDNRGFKGRNPAAGVEKFTEKKRERFLQPAELPKFFAAVNADSSEKIRDYVFMLLYVGQRRNNVEAMRWDELDLDAKTWQIPNSKSGKSVLVPLCTPAIEILERRKRTRDPKKNSPYVFPGVGKSGHLVEPMRQWNEILKRAGIEDLRLHDLRRTFGSFQAIGGSNMVTIGKSLGHENGSAATEIYARLHLDAVRQSIDTAVSSIVAAASKKEEGVQS